MLTITEALAEIQTIKKRLAKKLEFVQGHLWRMDNHRDPLEKQGGSVSAIDAERQSMADLQERLLDLRTAIAKANATTKVTINSDTRTIEEWLIWKREVAPIIQRDYTNIQTVLANARAQSQRLKAGLSANQSDNPIDITVHIDEQKFSAECENLEKTLGDLDGQLSLKNATVTLNL